MKNTINNTFKSIGKKWEVLNDRWNSMDFSIDLGSTFGQLNEKWERLNRNGRRALQAASVAGVMTAASASYGAGFALYEGSAGGTALGGGLVGRAMDASANFYNPATLSDLTNTVVTIGFLTEHPTADTSVDGRHGLKMDPGGFVLPHAYVAQPLGYGFTLGLGIAPEYGLGSHYNHGWALRSDTCDTTIEGFVFNPNLAYKITEDWSVAAGIRLLYFSFEQHSKPNAPNNPLLGGISPGSFRNHIDADNHFADWGWELSTRYRILKNLSVGAVYKSYIDTRVRGTSHTSVQSVSPLVPAPLVPIVSGQLAAAAAQHNGNGGADLRLPQSVTLGANWDPMEDLHLGFSATWTGWSSIQAINFDLPGGNEYVPLKWDDVIRVGGGIAYDFLDDWTVMGSYVYDQDPCSKYNNCTMLPPGDRHIATFGLGWRWREFEITACYGIVFMCSQSTPIVDRHTLERHKFDTHGGLSHSAGVSVTYKF